MLVTARPMVLRSRPVLEAMMPLPTPEMTPSIAPLLASDQDRERHGSKCRHS